MTEPDYPYPKRPFETVDTNASKADAPIPPPAPPLSPSSAQSEFKFICPNCKKVFKSNEELSMHIETTHQSPKKKL